MKQIAWGTSKLFWLYLNNGPKVDWAYVVDDFTEAEEYFGVPVRRSDSIRHEASGKFEITIFAVSSDSIAAILHRLASMGLSYGSHVKLYSDLFAADFAASLQRQLGWTASNALLTYSTAFTLNSRTPVHTTICGNWLILESLRYLKTRKGDVAEVGAYEGGNAICVLQSPIWESARKYYMFDSFEGFPDLSPEDPGSFSAGDYATSKNVQEVIGKLAAHKEASVIKGFVPETFSRLPADVQLSMVFYDCDLYQPALDTYNFCWDRLVPGGLILVHDYFAPPGGFEGVKKATDEFCAAKQVSPLCFWHNTMAVIQKV